MPEEQDQLIDEIARELRAPVVPDRSARSRIMAAVRAEPRPEQRVTAWGWLSRPRNIRMSPLAGMAVVAAAASVVVIATARDDVSSDNSARPVAPSVESVQSVASVASAASPVQFVLVAPSASRVTIVGDFNDWDATATPLRQETRAGLWSIVVPLRPGRHQYAFVVDGSHWLADPSAPRAADNDFGTPNSVIMVGEKRT